MENYPFLSISKYDFSPLLLFLAPKKRYCPQSYFFLNSYSGAKQLKFLQFQFCYHSDQFRSGIQLPYYTFFLSLSSQIWAVLSDSSPQIHFPFLFLLCFHGLQAWKMLWIIGQRIFII